MTLTELFQTFPPETIFQACFSGKLSTAQGWAEKLSHNGEDEFKIYRDENNLAIIYRSGFGPCFEEINLSTSVDNS